MKTPFTTGIAAFVTCTSLLVISPSQAQLSPESTCDLDGKPVEDCVRLLREAAAASDATTKERLTRQANESWITFKAKQDVRPLVYAFPEGTGGNTGQPPLEAYRSHLSLSLLLCKLSLQTAMTERELGRRPSPEGDYDGCISSGLKKAKELYDRTLPTLRKAGAKQALKEVHVAFSTALQGTAPGQNETRMSYTSRQASLDDRLNAAIARLDIEK